MEKPVIVFLCCLVAGIALVLLFYNQETKHPPDVPLFTPNRTAIVPTGTASKDVIQTSDEQRIPELMEPTKLVSKSTNELLDLVCEGGSDRCKLQAIYDFVRLNYEYTQTTIQHNYIQAPDQTLIYGQGDSLELALLLSSMQRAAGFENEILIGPYSTYVRVQLDNATIIIDPACVGCKIMSARVSLSGYERVFA